MITANEARIVANENLDKAIARVILEQEVEKEKIREQNIIKNIINISRDFLTNTLSKIIGEKIAERASEGYNSITISCGDEAYISAPWYSDLFIKARTYSKLYSEHKNTLNNGQYCLDNECQYVYDYTIFIRKIITKILNNNGYKFTTQFHNGYNKYSNCIDFKITW